MVTAMLVKMTRGFNGLKVQVSSMPMTRVTTRSMPRLIPVFCAALTLVACASGSGKINFNAMSAEELAAHNAGLAAMEQIVCVTERRSGSHIKATQCMSRKAFQERDLGVVSGIRGASVDSRAGIRAW